MFVFILCILGAISLSVTSAFTFLPVHVWYDFWKPLLMFIAGYLGGVVIAWIFIDICGRIMSSYKKKYDRPSKAKRYLVACPADADRSPGRTRSHPSLAH